MKKIDITGQRFTHLVVTEVFIKKIGYQNVTYARCVCDCGKKFEATSQSLRRDGTVSCGCKRVNNKISNSYISNKDNKMKERFTDAKMSREMIIKFRNKAIELKKECKNLAEVARAMRSEFPIFAKPTIADYTYTVLGVTEKIWEMYLGGQITFKALGELGRWAKASDDTKDFVADEIIASKLNSKQIAKIKAEVKNGRMVFDAIKRAKGTIEVLPMKQEVKKIAKGFNELTDDVSGLSMTLRSKIEMIKELMPTSLISESGGVHIEMFEKVYLLRHVLQETFTFVDGRIKAYIDEVSGHMKRMDSVVASEEILEAEVTEIKEGEKNENEDVTDFEQSGQGQIPSVPLEVEFSEDFFSRLKSLKDELTSEAVPEDGEL